VKIGKSASEKLVLLTLAYGEYVMKKFSVSEWLWWFKEAQGVQGDQKVGSQKHKGQMQMLT
jgi:hypothetical protein